MKCARCGYFNLPGSDICGRCGGSLSASADVSGAGGAQPIAFEEIYPPRARSRGPFEEVAANLRRQTAPMRSGAAAVVNAFVVPEWQAWMAVSFAVIPGIVQIFQGRTRQGIPMILGLALLVVAFASMFRQVYADVFLWLLAALSVCSVWEAADAGFGVPHNIGAKDIVTARGLRTLRLLLLAVSIVAATVAVIPGVGSRWYNVWTIETDDSAPSLRAGDVVISRALAAKPGGALRRGDVILYRLEGLLPTGVETWGNGTGVERVIGLPGDVVEARRSTITVNGTALAGARLPLRPEPTATAVRVTVPAGDVCVWHGFTISSEEGRAAPATQPYLLVPRDHVEAAVVAICEPSAHRRWFR